MLRTCRNSQSNEQYIRLRLWKSIICRSKEEDALERAKICDFLLAHQCVIWMLHSAFSEIVGQGSQLHEGPRELTAAKCLCRSS